MNHTGCQFRDKYTVGGIVFYKHAFLVYSVSKMYRLKTYKFSCRESNRRAHSKPGAVPFIPEKQRNVVTEKE